MVCNEILAFLVAAAPPRELGILGSGGSTAGRPVSLLAFLSKSFQIGIACIENLRRSAYNARR